MQKFMKSQIACKNIFGGTGLVIRSAKDDTAVFITLDITYSIQKLSSGSK